MYNSIINNINKKEMDITNYKKNISYVRKDSETIHSFESCSTVASKQSMLLDDETRYTVESKKMEKLPKIEENQFELVISETSLDSLNNSFCQYQETIQTPRVNNLKSTVMVIDDKHFLLAPKEYAPINTNTYLNNTSDNFIGQHYIMNPITCIIEDYFSDNRNQSLCKTKVSFKKTNTMSTEDSINSNITPIKPFMEKSIKFTENITNNKVKELNFCRPKRKISDNIESKLDDSRLKQKKVYENENYKRGNSAPKKYSKKSWTTLRGYNSFHLYQTINKGKFSELINEKKNESVIDLNDNSPTIKKCSGVEEYQAFKYLLKIKNEKKNEIKIDKLNDILQRSSKDQLIYKVGSNDQNKNQGNFTKIKYITLDRLLNEIVYLTGLTNQKEVNNINDCSSKYKVKYVFLVTYETITTPMELFMSLIDRFFGNLPLNLTDSEKKMHIKFIENIRANILDFLKTWILEKPHDFYSNKELLTFLKAFITLIILLHSKKIRTMASGLLSIIENFKQDGKKYILAPDSKKRKKFPRLLMKGHQKKRIDVQYIKNITFIYDDFSNPKNIFFCLEAKEIAKQICLVDEYMFSGIKHSELPHLKKKNHNHTNNTANNDNQYLKIVKHTNLLSYYIIYSILKEQTKSGKIILMTKLYEILESLLALKNFQSFFIIMLALSHFVILRLKLIANDFNMVTSNRKKKFEEIYSASNGYSNLRKEIKNATFPMIPCMFLISKDIGKLESEESYVEVNGLKYLNFKKMEETYDIIDKVFQSQQINYNFQRINGIFEFLSEKYHLILQKICGSLASDRIEEYLFTMSLEQKQ